MKYFNQRVYRLLPVCVLLIGLFIQINQVKAQYPQLGQSGEAVNLQIKYLVNYRNTGDYSWDTDYYDGELVSVFFQQRDQYMPTIGIYTTITDEFLIINGTYQIRLRTFSHASVAMIKDYIGTLLIEFDGKYYNEDLDELSLVYLGDTGIATQTTGPVKFESLPEGLQKRVTKRDRKLKKEIESKRKLDEERLTHNSEIMPSVYDLAIINENLYDYYLEKMTSSLIRDVRGYTGTTAYESYERVPTGRNGDEDYYKFENSYQCNLKRIKSKCWGLHS